MTTQALGLPLDITWQRLGYSRDMIDTSFNVSSLPPKWRSSMAVYSYVVPEEQTIESYPDSRIVYLKLSCSITGFNISEDLIDPKEVDATGDALDDLQSSSWGAVQSEGWANRYWGCHGAIVQIAVYPSTEDDTEPDDFPFIQDFEPKKRELYETRSESGEFLSGSSQNINVQKGTTSTESTEESNILNGISVEGNYGPIGGGASVSGEWGTRKNTGVQTVDTTTTDASREKRESTSFSTTFSQMYQLFNGYHLGTNRAVFVISPRPHTVSGPEGVDFNLVNGHRKLEGIQEMFLVVRVPKKLKGICIQANLDTGHTIETEVGQPLRVLYRDTYDPEDVEQSGDDPDIPDPPDFPPDDGGGNDDGDGTTAEDETYTFLVVTRRSLRNCGLFNDDNQIVPTGAGAGIDPGTRPHIDTVVYEEPVAIGKHERKLFRKAKNPNLGKILVANQRNRYQRRIRNAMLSGFTSAKYKPRPVMETNTFFALTLFATKRKSIKLDDKLVDSKILSANELKFLVVKELANTRLLLDLKGRSFSKSELEMISAIRKKVTNHIIKPAKNMNYSR